MSKDLTFLEKVVEMSDRLDALEKEVETIKSELLKLPSVMEQTLTNILTREYKKSDKVPLGVI